MIGLANRCLGGLDGDGCRELCGQCWQLGTDLGGEGDVGGREDDGENHGLLACKDHLMMDGWGEWMCVRDVCMDVVGDLSTYLPPLVLELAVEIEDAVCARRGDDDRVHESMKPTACAFETSIPRPPLQSLKTHAYLYLLLEEARMLRMMKRLVMVSPAKAGQW